MFQRFDELPVDHRIAAFYTDQHPDTGQPNLDAHGDAHQNFHPDLYSQFYAHPDGDFDPCPHADSDLHLWYYAGSLHHARGFAGNQYLLRERGAVFHGDQ